MITVSLNRENDYGEWAAQARRLYSCDIPPESVIWEPPGSNQGLFSQIETQWPEPAPDRRPACVPKTFPQLARWVICHSDTERFSRLYRILWRLQTEKHFLGQSADPDIVWLTSRRKAISRDRHKMHAFVRFRKTGQRELASGDSREQFVSWFEPEHHILELAAPFFVKRFANMDWAILTPGASAFWNGSKLLIGSGAKTSDVRVTDSCEDLWKTYFASTFNPARLKVGAMMSEMPKKYWHNLPEAELIPGLIADAHNRTAKMRAHAITRRNPLADRIKKQG